MIDNKPGPMLPMAIQRHCFVKMTQDLAMLVGGQSITGTLNFAFIFSITDNTWHKATNEIIMERRHHACATMVVDSGDSESSSYFSRRIVVVGGVDYLDTPLPFVDALDFDVFSDVSDIQSKEWFQGPLLPADHSLLSPALLSGSDSKSIVLFGGVGETVVSPVTRQGRHLQFHSQPNFIAQVRRRQLSEKPLCAKTQ